MPEKLYSRDLELLFIRVENILKLIIFKGLEFLNVLMKKRMSKVFFNAGQTGCKPVWFLSVVFIKKKKKK